MHSVRFSVNHDGEPIVVVDGEVTSLVKDCKGFHEYVTDNELRIRRLKTQVRHLIEAICVIAVILAVNVYIVDKRAHDCTFEVSAVEELA